MTVAMMQELAEHPELVHRWTVQDYHRMLADGSIIEGDPYELLDGQVVLRIRSVVGEEFTVEGPPHARVVKRLSHLSDLFKPLGCHMQCAHPVTLPPHDEPEPDGAVIRGAESDFDDRHPGPGDILCVIEVSGKSLSRDRRYKRELYANQGIPMYVILNLVDVAVEVYTEPVPGEARYAHERQVSLDGSISFPTAAGVPVVVPVNAIFP
jgi:Uma2 family endonuclease